jgi:hypothetical protein
VVSMTPKWDLKVHEVAQNSFRHAYHLLSCISGQNHKTSIEEVSLTAQDAENEFRKLVTLLDVDGIISSDYRRIRKGPFPDSHDINLVELMDSPNSFPHGFSCNPTRPCIVRELFPLLQVNKSATALIRSDNFSLCRDKQNRALQQYYFEPNIVANKSSTSLISMDGSGIDKQKIRYSSSSKVLGSRNESSMLSSKRSWGVKSEASTRCEASTSGCHWSKRR